MLISCEEGIDWKPSSSVLLLLLDDCKADEQVAPINGPKNTRSFEKAQKHINKASMSIFKRKNDFGRIWEKFGPSPYLGKRPGNCVILLRFRWNVKCHEQCIPYYTFPE
uniref:Uncharacterized protein n=1 Tax=Romanomermis culicivorax TaxID=13658 RepID=A0A915IJU5_ROMCU